MAQPPPVSPPFGPIEPPGLSGSPSEHHRERAQSGPVPASPDESLLDSVSEQIAHPDVQGLVIQDWFCGVPPFPESAAPSRQPSDLLRDVGEEELHEARQVPFGSAGEQVKVVRSKDKPKELDRADSCCTREYAREDFIGPFRRTEQEAALNAPDGYKVNLPRVVHPKWPSHRTSPSSDGGPGAAFAPRALAISTTCARNEVFDTSSGRHLV